MSARASVLVPTRGSQSASRAAAILRLLSDERRPLSLTQVAARLDLAKSSALAVLVSLEASGLARKDEAGGYALGSGVVELAGSFLQSFDVVSQFKHGVEELPLLSREVVQLATLVGTQVLFLARRAGRSPLGFSAMVGDRFPASITAVGNALLASRPDAEVAELFSDPADLPAWTGRSTRTLPELLDKLRLARERGYAVDEGETNPEVYGLAVRVRRGGRFSEDVAVGAALRPFTVPRDHREAVLEELRCLRDRLESANVLT